MVQIVLSQLRRQQATHEGGLATTLFSNQRWHTFIAMKYVHLQPMRHYRTNPDSQKTVLFGAEAWDATEHRGHIILSIPVRQCVDERCDGIKHRHFL